MKNTILKVSVLALAIGAGCTKKNDNTTPAETSTATETAIATTAAAAASATPKPKPKATKEIGARYLLLDSGIRCVTTPCPSWTARPESGDDIGITHVDLAPLRLSKEKQLALRQKLTAGAYVQAEILEGPKEPTGVGMTIRIYAVHEAATK